MELSCIWLYLDSLKIESYLSIFYLRIFLYWLGNVDAWNGESLFCMLVFAWMDKGSVLYPIGFIFNMALTYACSDLFTCMKAFESKSAVSGV